MRDSLPLKLSAQLQLNSGSKDGQENIRNSAVGSLTSEEMALSLANDEDMNSTCKDDHTDIFMPIKESFLKSFKVMDKELKLHPSIDCYCSGTTAVTLIKQVIGAH